MSEVGNWVSGTRFWGREAEVHELSRLLRNGANISITAPRRIGKTSLMREVARRLEGEFAAIHVDLQSAVTLEDVVSELGASSRDHRELHQRIRDVFRGSIGSIEKLGYGDLSLHVQRAGSTEWQRAADRLLEEFVAHRPPIVVYVDELAIPVNRLLDATDGAPTPEGIARVDQLMSWLRAATIRHSQQLRFVIASSIGLAPILARVRLSATLNTFTRFELAPWTGETALGALRALANAAQIRWGVGAPEAVIERLGVCIPHHVQVFWGYLQLDARRNNVFRITVGDVERVFRADLLGSPAQAELSHYEERLALMLGERLSELAIDLLSESAIAGSLAVSAARQLASEFKPQQLRDVLDVLLHDGYLQLDGDAYIYPSAFLREWWKVRHRATHRLLADRGRHG